jgi:hypothetical protein
MKKSTTDQKLDRLTAVVEQLATIIENHVDSRSDLISPRHASDSVDPAEPELSGDEAQQELARRFETIIRQRRLELLRR